jgi:molybdopterin-containing oxidoreductase family iron-sulfur binding subunit
MEKCTMCVQRIRDAKHSLIKRGEKLTGKERLKDNELQTACQQACASGAIKFGDLLDPKSEASVARKDARTYAALNGDPEHKHYGIKTLPNVTYMAQLVDHKLGGHHGSDDHGEGDHGDSNHGKGGHP